MMRVRADEDGRGRESKRRVKKRDGEKVWFGRRAVVVPFDLPDSVDADQIASRVE